MDLVSLTGADVEKMREADIKTVDPDTLRDIREVRIDAKLPEPDRMQEYVRRIGNPYCYRHGRYTVKISFTGTDVTLEEKLISRLRMEG